MEKYTTLDVVQKLSNAKSITGGTSLITIYVPPLMNLSLISNQLNSELSTSQNIKNKTVKSSVQNSIKCAQQQLKLINQTAPSNGLVICSGLIESCI